MSLYENLGSCLQRGTWAETMVGVREQTSLKLKTFFKFSTEISTRIYCTLHLIVSHGTSILGSQYVVPLRLRRTSMHHNINMIILRIINSWLIADSDHHANGIIAKHHRHAAVTVAHPREARFKRNKA